MSTRRLHRGFTLLELMITVAIVAILAAIALPSYRDYVVRGQLVSATTALSAMRARMEQYYQDNRTYAQVGTAPNITTPPCSTATTSGLFTVVCGTTPGAATYTITATGSGSVAGFVYTINQTNTQTTVSVGANWPAASGSCWLIKRGTTC
jgi:type IV pilus assembly protein PilE